PPGVIAAWILSAAAPLAANTQIVTKIATGGQPCGIAEAGGSVWVTEAQGARLLRIDPATNKVVGWTALDSTPCELHGALGSPVGRVTYDLAFGAGSIWVTNREGRTVQRVAPATNRVTKTLRFPGGGKPAGIAFSGGGLWIGDDVGTAVYRLDAKRLRWQRVPTKQLASSWVAASPGAVWVSNTASNTVTRI